MSALRGFGVYNNQERMAPTFRLLATTGQPIALWDYKQRRPVVLYCLPRPDRTVLTRLQTEQAAYKAQGAQLLVIVPAEIEPLTDLAQELGLTYPLLADEQGRIYRQYLAFVEAAPGGELPYLVAIADRYGAVSRYATALNPAELPAQEEITGMLEFLGNLCNP